MIYIPVMQYKCKSVWERGGHIKSTTHQITSGALDFFFFLFVGRGSAVCLVSVALSTLFVYKLPSLFSECRRVLYIQASQTSGIFRRRRLPSFCISVTKSRYRNGYNCAIAIFFNSTVNPCCSSTVPDVTVSTLPHTACRMYVRYLIFKAFFVIYSLKY